MGHPPQVAIFAHSGPGSASLVAPFHNCPARRGAASQHLASSYSPVASKSKSETGSDLGSASQTKFIYRQFSRPMACVQIPLRQCNRSCAIMAYGGGGGAHGHAAFNNGASSLLNLCWSHASKTQMASGRPTGSIIAGTTVRRSLLQRWNSSQEHIY